MVFLQQSFFCFAAIPETVKLVTFFWCAVVAMLHWEISGIFVFLQVLFLYRRYFFSMATIVNTVLDIVNERVFPTTVHGYEVCWSKR